MSKAGIVDFTLKLRGSQTSGKIPDDRREEWEYKIERPLMFSDFRATKKVANGLDLVASSKDEVKTDFQVEHRARANHRDSPSITCVF